jgi:predicted thioesterase
MEESNPIRVGLTRKETFLVEEEHSAPHVGSGTVRVLATPWMIAFMEITARKLLDEHLPDSHTSVGVHVDIHHVAAAKVEAVLEAKVAVISYEGRRIGLSVKVAEGDRVIGEGSHQRVIVDKEKFLARVQD